MIEHPPSPFRHVAPLPPLLTRGPPLTQDPSGDIARNAKLILNGQMPVHFTRFADAAALRRAVSATTALADKPTGCVFVGAPTDRAAADSVCKDVLTWLGSAGYDLENDIQVRHLPRSPHIPMHLTDLRASPCISLYLRASPISPCTSPLQVLSPMR